MPDDVADRVAAWPPWPSAPGTGALTARLNPADGRCCVTLATG